MINIWCERDALLLHLYIQPRSNKDHIAGTHGYEIKVAIMAQPVDGKANDHLISFLAKEFGVAKSCVTLKKGKLGRHKQIRIYKPKKLPKVIAHLLNAT